VLPALRVLPGPRRPLVLRAPRVLPGLRVHRLLTNCYKNCAII
jgi:hypothetical protein